MNQLYLTILLFSLLTASCQSFDSKKVVPANSTSQSKIDSTKTDAYTNFTLRLTHYNYTGDERIYVLTNDSLYVSLSEFRTDSIDRDVIEAFEKVNIHDLEERYINPRIKDGLRIHLYLSKQNTSKSILLQNYYQKDLNPVIDMINETVPSEHKLLYNKEWLIEHTPKE